MKKQVILKENIVSISFANERKFYGAVMGDDGERGFITRDSYWPEGNYTVRSVDAFTKGNGWTHCDAKTLHGCIEKILAEPKGEVYQFDTFKELMEWVVS